jgi:hypothetical protein
MYGTIKYEQMAIQRCVLTAFSEYPQNFLMVKFCLNPFEKYFDLPSVYTDKQFQGLIFQSYSSEREAIRCFRHRNTLPNATFRVKVFSTLRPPIQRFCRYANLCFGRC